MSRVRIKVLEKVLEERGDISSISIVDSIDMEFEIEKGFAIYSDGEIQNLKNMVYIHDGTYIICTKRRPVFCGRLIGEKIQKVYITPSADPNYVARKIKNIRTIVR